MDYTRNRKYPRTSKKQNCHGEEKILNLSASAAAGIVAAAFIGGTALGYMLKRKF